MKTIKKSGFLILMILSITLITSCSSFFGKASKQTTEGGDIELYLPYGPDTAGSARAATGTVYDFEITVTNTDTGKQTVFLGKSGAKIIYKNTRPGNYEITAKVFSEEVLCFEGHETAVVKAGKTTAVTVALKRLLRLWAVNDDYLDNVKRYFDEHPQEEYILETKTFGNFDEFSDEVDKALRSNAGDAPDLFAVEDPFLLRYTQGDMQGYTLPYEALGISQSQIDDAQFYDYVLQMGTGSDGKIHGLGYQSTAGAMIYNKAIAEELERAGAYDNAEGNTEEKLYNYLFVEGDDDPPISQLLSLSDTLDELSHGDNKRYLVSTYDDLWKMYRAQEDQDHFFSQWIDEQNNLILNPHPDYFYNEYVSPSVERPITCHNADPWSDDWFSDMTNDQVFAFFAPAWFINLCLKDSANVSNNKWGIIQSPVPFTWGGSFLMVNKNLPEVKKGIAKRIIEWLMLDTSNDGLMYKVASESKDTVTSKTVMSRIIQEGKGNCETLCGADIFTIYHAAAQSVNAEYKTPYDSTLDDMFMREIRDHKNFGLPREGTLMRFELNVFRRFGFRGDDIHDEEFTLNHQNSNLPNSLFNGLTVKPCNEGIQFIISFNGNPKEQLGGNCISTFYIRNAEDGIAMFIEDLLDAKNFGGASDDNPIEVTCIYPANIEKDGYYSFDFNFMIFGQEPEYDEEYCIPFIAKAGGGNQYVTYKDYGEAKPTMDNFNISFPEKHTFDVKPANSYFSCFTFSNEVTEKKMDCMIYGKYNREGFEEETVLYSYDCDHCGDFTQGTVISINDSGWPFIFTNYFNNISNSFEENGKNFWPFSADVTVNFWIEGFNGCRFRMPPVRSNDYRFMTGTEGDDMVDYIALPDGTILTSYIRGH